MTITTGELRAALQPIVFLRLTADHESGFTAGTIVAAQYWGAGKVVLTRFPDGATLTPVAHEVHGDLLRDEPEALPPLRNPADTPAWRRTGITDRQAAGLDVTDGELFLREPHSDLVDPEGRAA